MRWWRVRGEVRPCDEVSILPDGADRASQHRMEVEHEREVIQWPRNGRQLLLSLVLRQF